MSPEQLAAVLTVVVGAPFLVEFVKRFFDSKNLNLQSSDKSKKDKEDREWVAMNEALERERRVYNDILNFERQQFATRLTEIEVKLSKIQEEALKHQKAYWEERLERERLQSRVDFLEKELAKKGLVS